MTYPGSVKFNVAGHRVDAPLVIVSWQNTAHRSLFFRFDTALAVARWPKSA
jgi:hypothetical protein